MLPNESDVVEVTRAVWEAMLREELAGPLPVKLDGPTLTTAVDISGDFAGTVVLTVPASLAWEAAARFLECDPVTIDGNDAQEVVSELANMIGGNVKGLLSGTHHLSLPRPMQRAELPAASMTIGFDSALGPFEVALVQRATA